MPIPEFDHNDVLPPHLGDPRRHDELSPFPATSLEVCQRFGTTPARKLILQRWLGFRARMNEVGITSGVQWLDGSFMENRDAHGGDAPNDLDLVTFYDVPPGESAEDFLARVDANFPEFFDPFLSRRDFFVDHFSIHLGQNGISLVDTTRYFTGLFSHRSDGVWKGMLCVELNTLPADTNAAQFLSTQ